VAGLGETPWVDRNLQLAWERILAVAPRGGEGMPLVEQHGGRGKAIVQEFGCGHYGCVMPTSVPGLVAKLSSDPTEAFFVAAALRLGGDNYDDAGIVRYAAVYQIRNAYHRRRPLFVLWREEAYDIGFPMAHRYGDRSWEARRDQELTNHLVAFKDHAGKARVQLQRATKAGDDPFALAARAVGMQDEVWGEVWWGNADVEMGYPSRRDRAYKIARELRACAIIAEMMENTDGSDTIGRALGYYLDNGLLLADVHANNVGKVERHDDTYDGEVRVITDPGHAVPLEPRWAEVVIEEI